MKYSKLFGKSLKSELKDDLSINARYLIRGGFIDKLMSGSYTLMPLGYRVLKKIEKIIREEINATGAQELLMPLLHPKEVWNETGRWDKAKEVMYQFKKNEKEFALSFTHEEIVLDLVRKHAFTYKDYPIKIYHFSTKFRNELRARSGILRGREFIMKDLYSLHTTKEDLDKYYFEVSEAYKKIFKRIGFDVKVVEASGGVFTDEHTHEFQAICETGEDTIYYCQNCDYGENKEVVVVKEGDKCPKCEGIIKEGKAIEVGNIFRFGTVYSERMNIHFMDKNGEKKFAYFGSYGIGITRLLGTLVELFHDDKGIVWPQSVNPFDVYLVHLGGVHSSTSEVNKFAEEVYTKLKAEGIEVLYDDREDVSAGEKFATADLIGIPVRLVVSNKTIEAGNKIEFKKRDKKESELLDLEAMIQRIKI